MTKNIAIRIRKNLSYLLLSEVAVRAMTLILTIYLAQQYSPEKLGIYALALSVGTLFEIIGNMGLGTVFLQRVSAHWENAEEELSHFLSLRIVLSIVSFAALLIAALLLNKNAETFHSIVLAGLYYSLLSVTAFLWATFDAKQKMGFTAVAKLLIYPLIFLLGIWFIWLKLPVSTIFIAYVGGIIISLIFTIITIQKRFCHLQLKFNLQKWKDILKQGWPIALIGAFVFVYNSVDTIILSIIKGETAVGLYHAGYKIIGTIFIMTTLINQAYFPPLVQAKQDPHKLGAMFSRAMGASLFWSIPITLGGILLADRIILFIYGPAYIPAITAFKILMINCLIYFLSAAMINLMYSLGKQRRIIKIFFLGAITNIVTNILVIPTWGIEGAAVTTIVSELIVLIGIFFMAKKEVRFSIFQWSWKSILAGAFMTTFLLFFHPESLILTIALGALMYFAVHALLSPKLLLRRA